MEPTCALKLAVIGLTIVLSMDHFNDGVLAGAGDVNANAAYVCVYDSVFGQPVRRALIHLALPGIVWLESQLERGAGRVEVEPAAVEVDGHLEALAAAKAA